MPDKYNKPVSQTLGRAVIFFYFVQQESMNVINCMHKKPIIIIQHPIIGSYGLATTSCTQMQSKVWSRDQA
jgi:hypothetical protein